jgi:hypothetical protein
MNAANMTASIAASTFSALRASQDPMRLKEMIMRKSLLPGG